MGGLGTSETRYPCRPFIGGDVDRIGLHGFTARADPFLADDLEWNAMNATLWLIVAASVLSSLLATISFIVSLRRGRRIQGNVDSLLQGQKDFHIQLNSHLTELLRTVAVEAHEKGRQQGLTEARKNHE